MKRKNKPVYVPKHANANDGPATLYVGYNHMGTPMEVRTYSDVKTAWYQLQKIWLSLQARGVRRCAIKVGRLPWLGDLS